MARPSKWDEYETTLLVEAYIKVTKGGENKKRVLQELSNSLRQMAVNKGIEIDDVYRNLNGMMWQYVFMEKTFKNSGFGQHMPAKVFRYVVELYMNNRKKFEELLKEANKRVNPNMEARKVNAIQLLSGKSMTLEDENDSIVNFIYLNIYNETRPYLISYAGRKIKEVTSWSDTYIEVMRFLQEDYPNVVDEISHCHVQQDCPATVTLNKSIHVTEVRGKFAEGIYQNANSIIGKIKILLDQCDISYADLKIYYRRLNETKSIEKNNTKEIINEYNYQNEIRMILQKHYMYGYRINSTIELNRLKKVAELEGRVLPNSDEHIKAVIRDIGCLIDNKMYIISNNVLDFLSSEFQKLYFEGHSIFFYESFLRRSQEFMEENNILSEDMLKEILKQNRQTVFEHFDNAYFAKNFISLKGKVIENEAVTGEIIRCWGNASVRESNSFSEELPYIPDGIIKKFLSMNRKFAWVSEGAYVLVDRLIISQTEEKRIYDFVLNSCDMNGFVSISDIPIGNLFEENYELTFAGLFTAIYNKFLFRDFHLNGKILTKEKSDLDAITLVKDYLENKQICTFDEANQKVSQLTGGEYRYMAYRALYDSFVRISKSDYVSDSLMDFDINSIDQILDNIITDRGFIAVKEVLTFVLFPVSNYAWNHYLLESYCYRFSNKYSLRYKTLNDKNTGIIAEKEISDDYDDLLVKAVARANVPLQPDIVGIYLADYGYTVKKKFAGLENLIEKAALIRKEI